MEEIKKQDLPEELNREDTMEDIKKQDQPEELSEEALEEAAGGAPITVWVLTVPVTFHADNGTGGNDLWLYACQNCGEQNKTKDPPQRCPKCGGKLAYRRL